MNIPLLPDWIDNPDRIVSLKDFAKEIHNRLGVPVRHSRALALLMTSLLARLVSENKIVYFPRFGFLGLWTDRNARLQNYALRYPRFTVTKGYLEAIHKEDRSGKTPHTRIIPASQIPLSERPGRVGKRKLSSGKVATRTADGQKTVIRNNHKPRK